MLKLILTIISLALLYSGPIAGAHAAGLPLSETLQHRRFITYTPRSFSIAGGKVAAASEVGIREDLKLLRPFFDGLITYASTDGIEAVPMVGHDLAYRAIILGIWDPTSEQEIQHVISAVKKYPALISAVIVGNEGLFTKRYLPEDVTKTIRRLQKECPSLPTSTSEPFFLYFKKEYTDFFNSHELLMPNVHPVFEKWFDPSAPEQGVEMVLQVAAQFKKSYRRPLLIKETGMPSGQESRGFSPERQAQFWAAISKRFPPTRDQSFACFEAFDAPWKPAEMAKTLPGEQANEAFWGFFTADGRAKPVVKQLPKLIAD